LITKISSFFSFSFTNLENNNINEVSLIVLAQFSLNKKKEKE
jgi:hypothetical protein